MSDQIIHGGQVYQVAKRLGRSIETLIDFSASVNPLGPSVSVVQAMRDAIDGCHHYPDPLSEDLRVRLSREYRISEESILLCNGSVESIHILPKALNLRKGLIVGPTFSEFENSLRLAGVTVASVNAISARRYAPPIEKLQEVLGEWELTSARRNSKVGVINHAVFMCNPNSPTGRSISRKVIRQILDQVNRIGCWIIVDEAFMDWCPSLSLIKDLSIYPRLIILRSFTKFFAIPGIRLGYLITRPEVIEAIRKYLPPWSVNHVAQAAGMAALTDVRFRRRSSTIMRRERTRFLGELRKIPGLRVIPTVANFVMVEVVGRVVVESIVRYLQNQGILVRDCQSFSGVTKPALRFAVRLRRDNNRLIRALKNILPEI